MYWLLALALVVVLFFLLSSLPSWLVPASTGTTTTTTRRPRMRFTRISSVWGFLKSLRWYLFALAIALGLVWLLGAEKTNSIFAWMWRFLLDTDQEQVRGWYGAGAEEIPSLTFSSHFLLKVAGISAVIGLASLLLFKKKKLWRTVLIGIVSIPIVAALLAFWGDLSGSVGGFDSSDAIPWLVSTPWTIIHWLGSNIPTIPLLGVLAIAGFLALVADQWNKKLCNIAAGVTMLAILLLILSLGMSSLDWVSGRYQAANSAPARAVVPYVPPPLRGPTVLPRTTEACPGVVHEVPLTTEGVAIPEGRACIILGLIICGSGDSSDRCQDPSLVNYCDDRGCFPPQSGRRKVLKVVATRSTDKWFKYSACPDHLRGRLNFDCSPL